MKIIKFFMLSVISLVLCFLLCIYGVSKYYDKKVDITSVNEIFQAVKQNEGQEQDLKNRHFSYEFTVIQEDGFIPYTSMPMESASYERLINESIRNQETVLYYSAGAVIIYSNEFKQTQKADIILLLSITGGILFFLILIQSLYLHLRLLRPFQKLQNFASSIANGQFDLPLPMDRNNFFGAFTESFDLMRDELKAAQEKAILLEKQKNEMVASLSHDIKTPLSSIIAVSEIMLLTEKEEKKIQKLKGIEWKAAEIDRLISDLFQTTLEDLSELKVATESHSSEVLTEIIQSADLLNRIEILPEVPPCLVLFDRLRMGQVFSNIISNSYKYADSPIEIQFQLVKEEKQMLLIHVKDFGNSLNPEEVGKLGNKFFRGSNTDGKQGAGLGLYNCRMLLARMGGYLEFSQEPSGFSAWVYLSLS